MRVVAVTGSSGKTTVSWLVGRPRAAAARARTPAVPAVWGAASKPPPRRLGKRPPTVLWPRLTALPLPPRLVPPLLQVRGVLEELGQLTGMVGSIEYGLAEDRWGPWP
jgi:hypothetical protein